MATDERGDPESSLRWTTKSLRHLTAELTHQGYRVAAPTVGRLLKESGFSLQGTAVLDPGSYPTGIAVSRDQLQALPITAHTEHGAWNYSIAPIGGTAVPPRADQRAAARARTLAILADPRLTGMSKPPHRHHRRRPPLRLGRRPPRLDRHTPRASRPRKPAC